MHEIFGPVLAVQTFRTVDEVIQKANNTPYGLSAGVWTDKGSKIFNLTSKLRAGVIMGGAMPTSFLVASGEDLAARRGARTEHSRGYVRIEATKYGGERPSRSPKDDVGIAPNTYNKFDPTSPFGGYKESGYGREGGLHGLGAYLKLN